MTGPQSDEPLGEMLNNLVGALEAGGVFDALERTDLVERIVDPQWSRPRWVHVHSLLRGNNILDTTRVSVMLSMGAP